jgi:HEAT repeat protein
MKPESEKLIAGLKSDSADQRYAAWVAAAGADPEVIPEIARLLEAPEPGVRKAADEGLKKLVHSVGKQAGTPRRAQVVQGLLALTAPKQPKWTRTIALRHLSLIGGDETVAVAAKILREPDLQEEAVFCIERIPGAAADQALIDGLAAVKPDFQPRIFAALGHRRTASAAKLASDAMESKDLTIAIAAMKAMARIGRGPGSKSRAPDYNSLSDWDKIQFADSVVRYANAMVATGNPIEAIGLYKLTLDRGEPHLQCAALLGLSRLSTPEAAALIDSRLNSPIPQVRITARKAKAGIQKL